jgi:hypothetical protein
MGEKVLFEMRVRQDDDGTHVEINTAPEWQEAHRQRHARHHHLFAWMGCCGAEHHKHGESHRPAAEDLHRTLDSLQQLYDDLYGSSVEATS